MLLRAITVRSSYILILLLCAKNCLAYMLDSKRCLAVIEEVTEAAKVEDVKSVLFNENLSAITDVKYGQHIKLICDIQLSSPMNFLWKARHKVLTNGLLSEDHKELDIKSVNMNFHGEYVSCHASLVHNPKKLRSAGTNIRIIDLAPPSISNLTRTKITVMENTNMTITCKIIGGVPQPTMSWKIMRTGEKVFRDLHTSGEEYTVENATFADAGQYQCIAKNVRRHVKKTIDVFVQKIPVAIIEQGSEKSFPYASTTEFTCKVEGYPVPKTIWRDSKGNKLDSEENIINWHTKISKIKLPKMKTSNNYSCNAKNALGEAVSSVVVVVLSPFVVHQYPEETTDVHHGALTSIVCNITSSFPMRIKWFRQKIANSTEMTEIHTSNKKFSICSDETKLSILSTDMSMVGNYTCEASLVSDENEKKTFTTDVQIDDLAVPLLSDTSKIIVMETNWITLYCNVVGGVPRPSLSWKVKKHGDTVYTNLLASEVLDIENITIAQSGMYQCIVENPIGQLIKTTEVLVRKAPVADIKEGSAISVAYGSNNTFTCMVIAYPLPNITWQDTKGAVIKSEDNIKHEHKTVSQITAEGIKADISYTCHAENSLGEAESSIRVTVLSPFVVHEHTEDITNVHYAASRNLICNITATFPMRIRWFHNMSEIHDSIHYTISSDETKLNIKSMDLDLVGNYTCEAYLESDHNENKVFTTDVRIDDLRAPIITSHTGSGDPASVTVKNLEELSLACKAEGNPEPVITWYAQPNGTPSYQNIGSGESICSTNFGYAKAGKYKCTATNVAGADSRTIVVVVT